VAGKGTPATALLARCDVAHTLHTYEHDPRSDSFGTEAAEALGVPAQRVFKTLVADVDGRLTVGVVPVTGRRDLKAQAAAVGAKKARLADTKAAQRATGYVLGGISPLGQRSRLPTVVDASAEGFDTVLCSGGRRGLEIELAPGDLIALTGAVVAPICG
jgi:Cys-tRNA(Pro)/Cys-tRNA(Cys) deacylase